MTHYLYEEKWENPVDAMTFHAIAGKLAVAGAKLFEVIFESNRDTPLDDIADKLREVARTGERALTVNAADFHIPWRMLYTHPDPNEPLAHDGSNFDPRGFWGYQHIIEQFANDSYPLEYRLVAKSKLAFGAALHEKIDTQFQVDCLKRHRDFVQSKGERLNYIEWTKRAEVIKGLSAEPFQFQVIYFLCHAEGAGTTVKPNLQPPILELTDGTIDAIDLRESIHHRFKGSPPFVFINACRGGHFGTTVSHNFTFASEFLEQGAVCLIGPQIEVPAVFAGEFGKRFFCQSQAR